MSAQASAVAGGRAVATALLACLVASPATAQGQADRLEWRAGRNVRLRAHASLQVDALDVADEAGTDVDPIEVDRARVGVELRLLRRIDIQVEREVRDEPEPWRDVYANVEFAPGLELRAGRFKMPFSAERLEGGLQLDLPYRSLAASYLAPHRDTGIMVHGLVLRRRLGYQAGVFRHGGENKGPHDPPYQHVRSGRTVVGRVVVAPWARARASRRFRALELSAALTAADVPEGQNAVRGDTVFGERIVPHLHVNGRRIRLGGAVDWRGGPFSAAAEVTRLRDDRRGQGTDDDDLTRFTAHGWFVRGSWLVTGERKTATVVPKRPFPGSGAGAFEVAARVETLRAGGQDGGEPRSTSPRARSVAESEDRVWTMGLNWYPNGFVKVQVALVRERIDAPAFAAGGAVRAWSRMVRVQVGL